MSGGVTGAEARAGSAPTPDDEAVAELVVSEGDLASAAGFDGDLFPPVLATARMVVLMEAAAARVLVPHLAPGERSVGVSVQVTHTAATPPGSRVRARARFLGREERLYVFEVTARDEGGEIGRGLHQRAVVSVDRLVAGARRRVSEE